MDSATGKRKVRFGTAVGWASVLSWGQEGLAAASTFVLAFLLGPSDFGLVAIAMAYVGVFELFAAQGIVTAIVQSPEVDERDLDSVFWYTLSCGAVLLVVAALSSSAMAGFFGFPSLTLIVQALAFGILVRAATVVHEAKLIRDMNFKSLALRMNVAMLVSAAAGISAALAGLGAWALVIQWLTRVSGIMVVLWGASSWTPKLRLRSPRTRSLLSFSWKSFPATLFDYAATQTEPFVMGKLFGEAAVGIYRLASRVVDLVISIVTRALWRVSFPYLAEARGDVQELRGRISTCLRYALLFCVPIVGLLALESPVLIELMGEKWQPAVPVVRILCIYAVIRSLVMFNGPLLLAFGRPRTFSAVVGIQCVVVILSVVIAAHLRSAAPVAGQLAGIAWARVAAFAAVSLPVLAILVLRAINAPKGDLARVALPGLVVAAVALAIDGALISAFSAIGVPPVGAFFARVVLTGAATGFLLLVADRSIRETVLGRLRPVVQSSAGTAEE